MEGELFRRQRIAHNFAQKILAFRLRSKHIRQPRCPLGGPVAKVAPRPNPRDAGFSRPAATAAAGYSQR